MPGMNILAIAHPPPEEGLGEDLFEEMICEDYENNRRKRLK